MLTPEEQKILDEAKQIALKANLDLSDGNGNDFEQRYKNTQASFTKARQAEIEMAKLLVESDPRNIERITDEVVRNKILQEKYGVDNLEELKILFPNALKKPSEKNNDDDGDELSEIEKLQQEVNLMKYQNSKIKTNEGLEDIKFKNKDIVATINGFDDLIKEELKYISDSLDAKTRIDKAFRLVVGAHGNSADAYSVLQGITIKKDSGGSINDYDLKKNQNDLRKLLGLKQK